MTTSNEWDLIVIGAGAAGLATGIFAGRQSPRLRIACVDGARHIGAKILVSGGSRCNVTNREVSERDFWGGSQRFIRNVLRAFPAPRSVAFFAELGVTLHLLESDDAFVGDELEVELVRLEAALARAQAID